MPKLLIIDNYDSFTYNLTQAFIYLGADVLVYRNDQITVKEAQEQQPTHLLISPGPGKPNEAGICLKIIEHFLPTIPILGVCLGHQALAQLLGANLSQAKVLMHGKQDKIEHLNKGIFQGLPSPLLVGRYHSLAIKDPPPELEVTAWSTDGEIMAIKHKIYQAFGIQFHPESILCPKGMILMNNFLQQDN